MSSGKRKMSPSPPPTPKDELVFSDIILSPEDYNFKFINYFTIYSKEIDNIYLTNNLLKKYYDIYKQLNESYKILIKDKKVTPALPSSSSNLSSPKKVITPKEQEVTTPKDPSPLSKPKKKEEQLSQLGELYIITKNYIDIIDKNSNKSENLIEFNQKYLKELEKSLEDIIPNLNREIPTPKELFPKKTKSGKIFRRKSKTKGKKPETKGKKRETKGKKPKTKWKKPERKGKNQKQK